MFHPKEKVKQKNPSPNQYYYKPYYHGMRVAGYRIYKKSLGMDSIIAEVLAGEGYAVQFVEALNGYPLKFTEPHRFRTCLSCGMMIEDTPQALENHLKVCKGDRGNG